MQEFFLTVKSLLRKTVDTGPDSYSKWGVHEEALNDKSVPAPVTVTACIARVYNVYMYNILTCSIVHIIHVHT